MLLRPRALVMCALLGAAAEAEAYKPREVEVLGPGLTCMVHRLAYEKAVALLEKHFGEEGDDDENLLPSTQNGGFSFGAPAMPAAQMGFAF